MTGKLGGTRCPVQAPEQVHLRGFEGPRSDRPDRPSPPARLRSNDATPTISASSSCCDSASAPERTITTTSVREGKSDKLRRKDSRTNRLARFRATAPPILREATIPKRVICPSGQGASKMSRWRVVTRAPPSWTRKKSLRRSRRRVRGSVCRGGLVPFVGSGDTTSCRSSARVGRDPCGDDC